MDRLPQPVRAFPKREKYLVPARNSANPWFSSLQPNHYRNYIILVPINCRRATISASEFSIIPSEYPLVALGPH
jgi:hypothetical protein